MLADKREEEAKQVLAQFELQAEEMKRLAQVQEDEAKQRLAQVEGEAEERRLLAKLALQRDLMQALRVPVDPAPILQTPQALSVGCIRLDDLAAPDYSGSDATCLALQEELGPDSPTRICSDADQISQAHNVELFMLHEEREKMGQAQVAGRHEELRESEVHRRHLPQLRRWSALSGDAGMGAAFSSSPSVCVDDASEGSRSPKSDKFQSPGNGAVLHFRDQSHATFGEASGRFLYGHIFGASPAAPGVARRDVLETVVAGNQFVTSRASSSENPLDTHQKTPVSPVCGEVQWDVPRNSGPLCGEFGVGISVASGGDGRDEAGFKNPVKTRRGSCGVALEASGTLDTEACVPPLPEQSGTDPRPQMVASTLSLDALPVVQKLDDVVKEGAVMDVTGRSSRDSVIFPPEESRAARFSISSTSLAKESVRAYASLIHRPRRDANVQSTDEHWLARHGHFPHLLSILRGSTTLTPQVQRHSTTRDISFPRERPLPQDSPSPSAPPAKPRTPPPRNQDDSRRWRCHI